MLYHRLKQEKIVSLKSCPGGNELTQCVQYFMNLKLLYNLNQAKSLSCSNRN